MRGRACSGRPQARAVRAFLVGLAVPSVMCLVLLQWQVWEEVKHHSSSALHDSGYQDVGLTRAHAVLGDAKETAAVEAAAEVQVQLLQRIQNAADSHADELLQLLFNTNNQNVALKSLHKEVRALHSWVGWPLYVPSSDAEEEEMAMAVAALSAASSAPQAAPPLLPPLQPPPAPPPAGEAAQTGRGAQRRLLQEGSVGSGSASDSRRSEHGKSRGLLRRSAGHMEKANTEDKEQKVAEEDEGKRHREVGEDDSEGTREGKRAEEEDVEQQADSARTDNSREQSVRTREKQEREREGEREGEQEREGEREGEQEGKREGEREGERERERKREQERERKQEAQIDGHNVLHRSSVPDTNVKTFALQQQPQQQQRQQRQKQQHQQTQKQKQEPNHQQQQQQPRTQQQQQKQQRQRQSHKQSVSPPWLQRRTQKQPQRQKQQKRASKRVVKGKAAARALPKAMSLGAGVRRVVRQRLQPRVRSCARLLTRLRQMSGRMCSEEGSPWLQHARWARLSAIVPSPSRCQPLQQLRQLEAISSGGHTRALAAAALNSTTGRWAKRSENAVAADQSGSGAAAEDDGLARADVSGARVHAQVNDALLQHQLLQHKELLRLTCDKLSAFLQRCGGVWPVEASAASDGVGMGVEGGAAYGMEWMRQKGRGDVDCGLMQRCKALDLRGKRRRGCEKRRWWWWWWGGQKQQQEQPWQFQEQGQEEEQQPRREQEEEVKEERGEMPGCTRGGVDRFWEEYRVLAAVGTKCDAASDGSSEAARQTADKQAQNGVERWSSLHAPAVLWRHERAARTYSNSLLHQQQQQQQQEEEQDLLEPDVLLDSDSLGSSSSSGRTDSGWPGDPSTTCSSSSSSWQCPSTVAREAAPPPSVTFILQYYQHAKDLPSVVGRYLNCSLGLLGQGDVPGLVSELLVFADESSGWRTWLDVWANTSSIAADAEAAAAHTSTAGAGDEGNSGPPVAGHHSQSHGNGTGVGRGGGGMAAGIGDGGRRGGHAREPTFFLRTVFTHNLHEMRGYNRLMRTARGQIVALVQDDDVPPESCAWLTRGLHLFASRPRLGVAGFRHSLWRWRDTGWQPVPMTMDRRPRDALDVMPQEDPLSHVRSYFPSVVDVGPLMVRREVVQELGWFNEAMSWKGETHAGYGDYDLAYRTWLYGYEVMHVMARSKNETMGRTAAPGGTHVFGSSFMQREINCFLNRKGTQRLLSWIGPRMDSELRRKAHALHTRDPWQK